MPQVLIFLLKLLIIGIGEGFFEQSCQTEKEGFYLKQVVAMLVYRPQRQPHGPGLKGIAVQPEAKVARQGDEKHIFPMPVTPFQPPVNGRGLLLQTLHLQGRKPGMNLQLGERRKNGVTGRVFIGLL